MIEIKCTINIILLNHPSATPPPPTFQSVEKLFSMKPVPDAKNVGDHYTRGFKN